jgi:iron uptake system EfeUOB component EfeO/EfeM
LIPAVLARRLLLLLPLFLIAGCGGHDKSSSTAQVAQQRSAGSILAGSDEVPGAAPAPDLVPLPATAFRRPVARYRVYVGGRLRLMAGDVERLRAALAAGDRPAARAAWRSAYSHYLEVGAAYGAFGSLDQDIDGTPAGLRGGVRNRHFAGLHRIERGLWTGQPLAGLVGWANRLAADVKRLERLVPRITISPLDYATRAHEILEDAQIEQLTGESVPWSGEGVRGTAAALSGTAKVIGTLSPLLAGRGGALEPVEFGEARLRRALDQIRRAHGGQWPTLAQLRPRERELLDGDLGGLLEELSSVPGALETTQLQPTKAIPGSTK